MISISRTLHNPLQNFVFLCFLHFSHQISIDEAIGNAMTTPGGNDFMFDEASGIYRVEMDILMDKKDYEMIQLLNESTIGMNKRQAIQDGAGGARWSDNTVPYEIDTRAFSSQAHRDVLQDAMNNWMKYTCITFRPAKSNDPHRIKFVDGDGCASYVGRQQGSSQDVILAGGCRYKGTVIHELGHALGLHHEQTRPDRDGAVKIHFENIEDNRQYNFKKYQWSVIENVGVPYDYWSIMHYGKTYFAKDKSQLTIETLDPAAQDVIGNRDGLSFRDIKTMNKIYNCSPQNCRLSDSQCKGEGFVGMDCRCWCPAAVSKSGDPYTPCDQTSDNGNQNNWGDNNNNNNNGNNGNNGNNNNWHNNGGNNGNNWPNNGQSSACQDTNKNCQLWAGIGYCNNQRYKSNMYEYCKLSCNMCHMEPECADKNDYCRAWSQTGYCQSQTYYSYMQGNCKKSCGFCSDGGRHFDQLTPKCEDQQRMCPMWASQGFCMDHTRSIFMQNNCQYSCHYCSMGNSNSYSDGNQWGYGNGR